MNIDYSTWWNRVKTILLREEYYADESEAIHDMANYADELREDYDTGRSPREAACTFEAFDQKETER